MSLNIAIDVVSAEKEIFSGEAKMVFVVGSQGEMGIALGHTPLLTTLKPGVLRILCEENKETVLYISGGLLEVQPHKVTVLADMAERAEDIDEAAVLDVRNEAEKMLHGKEAKIDYAKALVELAQTAARLQAVRKLKERL